ncbi:hypothetical protein [Ornithinibacillus xuwenensis]|uniref:Uncharacterized protein n=1 Tax=Ornithinibacillus xuwenensis TaxID=3144668 RepID=A0ABU9XDD2_9BACI
MVRSKVTIIISLLIFGVCMSLFFPFPNNEIMDARTIFMSFPIRNYNGYIIWGIIGSFLFLVAMILLVIGLNKYRLRAVFIMVIVYSLLPTFLTTMYQETLASGVKAISYDGNGNCTFQEINDNKINGECNLVLYNRSNEAVTFELEFLDSYYWGDEARTESIMNLAGPYRISIEANQKKSINLKELLDLSDVSNHIISGTSNNIHLKLRDEEIERKL